MRHGHECLRAATDKLSLSERFIHVYVSTDTRWWQVTFGALKHAEANVEPISCWWIIRVIRWFGVVSLDCA